MTQVTGTAPAPRPRPAAPTAAPAGPTAGRRGPAGARTGAARTTPERLTGAQAIVRSLEILGVDTVFGLPGGTILPTYDPLMDSATVRHVLVRHEQGAGHAAEGYAVATGRVGVCMATSGPGATNLVTALADAHLDSVPLVAITGQVNSAMIGSDAFQEADIVGITMPVTKHSVMVRRAEDVPAAIAGAFHIASTGRPGPVLVDITKDAQTGTAEFHWPETLDLPGYRVVGHPHAKQVREAVRLVADAHRPVVLAGGGIVRSGAAAELLAFAEATHAPVVTTLTARGAFPDSHPQNLGMPGMHGTVPAVIALQQADLIVALGARFDDRVTGKLASFAPHARVVHADIDPAEISKNRTADVPIVGDCRAVLADLTTEYAAELARREDAGEAPADLAPWWEQLDTLRHDYPLGFRPTSDGLLSPQHVIERIGAISGPESVYVAGVGQHQMWAAQFVRYERPNSFISSSGLGTMGFAVPAAMGAKAGQPDRTVWAIDGDGCFQMTNQELATCTLENIPIKVAIINNSSLGMVRQWQTLFYGGRYSNTDLQTGQGTRRVPDFVALAGAYGCAARRVTRADEVDDAVRWAMSVNDRPVVVDFEVSPDAMVWPMVPAGVPNDEIQYARGVSPDWGGDADAAPAHAAGARD